MTTYAAGYATNTNESFALQPPANTWAAFSLAMIASWVRSYLTSGCAIESVLLVVGPEEHFDVPNYVWLAALNAAYLLASTSWLFHWAFAAICWPLIGITCIVQYATVSSFTRKQLRSWLKLLHFYRDKVAFFNLPSLIIDTELDGMVTIRGLTFNILDLSIELHGIEVGLDLGSGHELSIHSDAVTIALFRQVTIDEVYGVHWFTGDNSRAQSREQRADSHTDDIHSPQSKRDVIRDKFFPSVEETPASSQQDYVKDRVLPRWQDEKRDGSDDYHRPLVGKARRPSPSDVEAEQRYEDVLLELRQSNRLYQSRARVKIAHGNIDGDRQTDNDPDTRAAVCADLRNTRPPMSQPSGRIPISKLIRLFRPINRILDKVPSVVRVILWLLTQSHPVTCPSICFSACGVFLGQELLSKLFRRHTADDNRIEQLKSEVSSWLSAADIYLDLARMRARTSVPLRTTNDIRAELRTSDVVITRVSPKGGEEAGISAADEHTGRVARLKGVDSSFTIPTCLLPHHAYLQPPPEISDDEDTAPVAIAIRGSLPAHFSESFLAFAATLSKTSQMVDIEEEAGLAADKTDDVSPREEDNKANNSHNTHSHHGFRAKIAHGRIGAAIKHPVQHGKQILHKEVKKTAVDKVDGAWFAKWTNKFLKKLEWLDGDFGYSMEVPTLITRE